MEERKKKKIIELVELLEGVEHQIEEEWKINKQLKSRIQPFDYENEIGFRVFARADSDLSEILKANHDLRTIDVKQFRKLRKEDNKIGNLWKYLHRDLISYFSTDHVIHGDASINNFLSGKRNDGQGTELAVIDWEKSYTGALQQSIWTLLATAAPRLEDRLAIQDEVLEHAFKERYNIRNISDRGKVKEDFDQFKAEYERMDTYQSILQVLRQLDRKRKKIADGDFIKAQVFEESAKETYQHLERKLDQFRLQELKSSLRDTFSYVLSSDDLLNLGFEEGYTQSIKKDLGRRPFEQEAQKIRKKKEWKERAGNFLKNNYGKAIAAVAVVSGLLGGAIGDHGGLPEVNSKYQPGHQLTADEPYRLSAEFPGIEDIVHVDDDADITPLSFDEPVKLIQGAEESIHVEILAGQKIPSYRVNVSYTTTREGVSETFFLPSLYTRRYDFSEKNGGIPIGLSDFINRLPQSEGRMSLSISDYNQTHFEVSFPASISWQSIPKREAVNCVYDNVALDQFSAAPMKVKVGDTVKFYAELEFIGNNKACASLKGNYGLIKISDGTEIKAKMDENHPHVIVGCSDKSLNKGECEPTHTFVEGDYKIRFKSGLPSYTFHRFSGDDKDKLKVDFYLLTEPGIEVWMASSQLTGADEGAPEYYNPILLRTERAEDFVSIGEGLTDWEKPNGKEYVWCDLKKPVVVPANTTQTIEISCANRAFGGHGSINNSRFRIYIPELGIATDFIDVPELKGYDEVDLNNDYMHWINLSIPISLPSDVPPGMYTFEVEHSIDDEQRTFQSALRSFIEVGDKIPEPQPLEDFFKAALKNPGAVECNYNESWSNKFAGHSSSTFFSCVEMLRFIGQISDVRSDELYLDYTTQIQPIDRRLYLPDSKPTIVISRCDSLRMIDKSIDSIHDHYQLDELAGYETEGTGLFSKPTAEQGMITHIQSGDRNILFICNDYIDSGELVDVVTSTATDLTASTINVYGDQMKFKYVETEK